METITITATQELGLVAKVKVGSNVTVTFDDIWFIVRSRGHKQSTKDIQKAIVKTPGLMNKIENPHALDYTNRLLHYYSQV